MSSSGPTRPTIALAHEEDAIRKVASIVLEQAGFAVVPCATGRALESLVTDTALAAVVADVGLADLPGYEIAPRLRTRRSDLVIVLVSAVFRKTSYKRRPTRLYGADEYVELHHVPDHLPARLWRRLARRWGPPPEDLSFEAVRPAVAAEGDRRIFRLADDRIVDLVVADALLYGGSEVAEAGDIETALAIAAGDLDAVVEVLAEFGVYGADRSAIRRAATGAMARAFERMRREGR